MFTPITSPCEETSGPPELPGLSAASVWITSSISRPFCDRSDRPSAETTPAVTVELEAERIADRDHELAAPQLLGVAQGRGRQRHRRVDPQEGEVCIRIVADHAGRELAAFGGHQLDARRAADHVAVGQHQPIRRDDDAGAGARAHGVAAVPDVDPDHGRADAVDHIGDRLRIGIEQRRIVGRRGEAGGRRRIRVLVEHEINRIEHGNSGVMDLQFVRRYGVPAAAAKEERFARNRPRLRDMRSGGGARLYGDPDLGFGG